MKKNAPEFEANGIGVAVGDSTENLNSKTEYRADPLDWWRAVVDIGAGPNHGLVIGVISSCDGELVEVCGVLPQPLKTGLYRCASKRNRDCAIEWLTRPDGYGGRYAIEGLGDLIRLLQKRADLMQRGAK
jgi:hypothetical protein